MPYSLIDHTADIGIRVRSATAEALFAEAAAAMFDLICDRRQITPDNHRCIKVAGSDWPDLMVNWLRELLYLFSGEMQLVKSVQISQLEAYHIHARADIAAMDAGHCAIRHEIKAVTYHGITAGPVADGWEAVVIFDV